MKVSESAVRYYDFDREPPVSYLARVAEEFGYRPAWLLWGEEPALQAEAEAIHQFDREHEATWNLFVDHAPEGLDLANIPAEVHHLFQSVVRNAWVRECIDCAADAGIEDPAEFSAALEEGFEGQPTIETVATAVALDLWGPFQRWGIGSEELVPNNYWDYAIAMLHAISLAIRAGNQRSHWSHADDA